MITVGEKKNGLLLAATVYLSVLILGGCTSIKYSYDTTTGFSGLKSYAWSSPWTAYSGPDPLLEENVRAIVTGCSPGKDSSGRKRSPIC